MKRFSIFGVLALFLVFISYAMMHLTTKKPVQKQSTANNGFAVVELFTSEGCSSCPPADEALAGLLNSYKTNVYVLGFHVDYWNSLGWKDAYSNSAYSARQQQYGSTFKLGSIYTPQAIVNGKTEFTGSDTRRLHAAVEDGLLQSSTSTIVVTAKSGDNKMVDVSYQLSTASTGLLNVALVQLHAQSSVQRGENSGRVLHHVNVVRDFKTVDANEARGEIKLALPEGVAVEDCRIIAYTQDAQSLQIMAATETDIK